MVAEVVNNVGDENTPLTANSSIAVADQKSDQTPELECDFDSNPTKLYLSIQQKKWEEAVSLAKESKEECATWVSRKERDGKLRWRLLPLHAAIIFKAPEKTIEALLVSYPQGAQCKDDQGMLPIHLAFRNGSEEGAVNLLLVAYPESVDAKDRKGRVPLVLAQASSSPNKDAYIKALEKGPSYYAVAAAACSQKVVAEASPVPETQVPVVDEEALAAATKKHEEEMEAMKVQLEEAEKESITKIAVLEGELTKTQETSQVLVDHVNSLEAQLSSRSDTERFLATKIANLDSSLKETSRNKELIEAQLNAEKAELQTQTTEMKLKLNKAEDEVALYKSKYQEQEEMVKKISRSKIDNKSKLEERCKTLEMEWSQSMANAAVLEAQLKKKIQTEHTLASQVSDLAGKLAESAASNSSSAATYVKRIDTLEMEKLQLTRSVSLLTEKLTHVAKTLDVMANEQERIVNFAARHEETMAEASVQQQQIMADAARQEQILIDAAREREQIVYILTRQAEEIDRTTNDRERIMEAIKNQETKMSAATKEREDLIFSVSKQRASMDSLKTEIKELCKIDSEDLEDEEDEESDDEFDMDELIAKAQGITHDDKTPDAAAEKATPESVAAKVEEILAATVSIEQEEGTADMKESVEVGEISLVTSAATATDEPAEATPTEEATPTDEIAISTDAAPSEADPAGEVTISTEETPEAEPSIPTEETTQSEEPKAKSLEEVIAEAEAVVSSIQTPSS